MVAAVIETHYDEYGIVWPPALAPFDVHLLTLGIDEAVQEQADAAYAQLGEADLEVLYDDRNASAGAKFADADMIGCPMRITVSKRSVAAKGYELKARWAEERQVVAASELVTEIRRTLADFQPLVATSTSSTMRS